MYLFSEKNSKKDRFILNRRKFWIQTRCWGGGREGGELREGNFHAKLALTYISIKYLQHGLRINIRPTERSTWGHLDKQSLRADSYKSDNT
jgi:hypothetical protein